MAYQKSFKKPSNYKGNYKKKGTWQGGNKQNYTYPKKQYPNPTPSNYDPKLDGVWEWNPLTKESKWYSLADYKKLEEGRVREWTKKHKQNASGIWIPRDEDKKD